MDLPDNAFSKGIKRPDKATKWLSNRLKSSIPNFIDEFIVTPRKAEYLFDHDWDLAIILDGCRYDLAEEYIQNNSTKLDQPKKVYSAGSMSPDWIRRTFEQAPNSELNGTVYITGNVFSDKVPQNELRLVEKVWEYAWDKELETVPPRPLTDRTIELMRDDAADRYLVHYMQPHLPSIQSPTNDINGFQPFEGQPSKNREGGGEWELAKKGQSERVIKAYQNNLRPVMEDVELLLETVDAPKVVITADHGNYLGELGRWGHPSGHTHSAVRHVPWWETSASKKGEYQPTDQNRSTERVPKEEKLEALGYLQSG